MSQPDFLQKSFAGKSPQLRQLAVKILNIYLTSPLSSRDDTSDDRKVQVRKLVEQAVRASEHGSRR
jgi:hypothetical protein